MGNYGLRADMWAVGVMVYLLIYGQFPFDADTMDELFRRIMKNKPKYKVGGGGRTK